MTSTRRKTKAAAAAAAVQQEAASAQETPSTSTSPTFFLSLPPDIDIDALNALIPGESLETPSEDAVLRLYRTLLAHATRVDATTREVEALRAEAEKKEVELDQAYQDRENDKKELENFTDNLREELKTVKAARDELAAARAALQTQLSSASSSHSASSAELGNLKTRVEDVEREKRDLVSIVSRLKEDCVQRDEEISTLRANLKQSRHEYQELEGQVRELRSTENSSKYKLDSLSQQLTLAKEESERATNDLNQKSDEFSKYRRSKHAELMQVQAERDALVQSSSTSDNSIRALQAANKSLSQQLTQALTRVQDLTGQLAEQEATYSSEAAGLRRLVVMMEEREQHAKEIVDGLERDWATVGEKAERREMKLKDEIEREAKRADDSEKRVQELERLLRGLDTGDFSAAPSISTVGGVPRTPGSVPSTPARGAVFASPGELGMTGLSPTVAMASRAQRGGKTFTEVYSEHVRLQDEYARKSAEYDHMDRTLQAVLAQIEERAPILTQQRLEYERLQAEAGQLASQLSSALMDRDTNATLAQETSQRLKKTVRENELLESQLNDLGLQVRTLTKELARIQDPSIPSDEELEADPSTEPATNMEEVITNNLVRFRSIQGLQEQNQRLLKIVRDLGAKMEAEEKEYRENLQQEQAEAVLEAHQALQKMQEDLENQKKSHEVTIQAYLKERDALKVMLARSEARAPGSTSGINGDPINGVSDSDLAKELAEVQNQFETYKHEMGTDTIKLREDVMLSQKEAAQLSAALAKANARIEYLTDRQRMAQEQLTVSAREIESLAKRNQHLHDKFTRADIECHRFTEDLVAANAKLDQLRNESANLRAEKKIWESVQTRLVEENRTLGVERSHLSDLMSNVQKMHNDLERSGENDRRRLESQIQMLEGQTQDLRGQLGQERDSVRHISLQKEIEVKDLQTRLEKSVEELGKTREALVGAETSRKHLDERVQELTRRLQGDQEKLAVYERRSTTDSTTGPRSTDESLTREQQLEAEVAELRASLKIAEVDLANARSHVLQFQEISKANEEALISLNTTYDDFKASTESQIATYESEQTSLHEKLEAVQVELRKSSEALATVRQNLENERRAWTEDKKLLEDTIADMSSAERTVENAQASRLGELQQLEERAKSAEEKYGREIVAHAESIKVVEELRQQLAGIKLTVRDTTTAAETAQTKLSASEISWSQQKKVLEKEVSELNLRCKDLVSQNSLLHNHLESVSTQAAKIRDAATSSSATPVEGEEDSSDGKLAELRSVVGWLRKEKEIVELQLELSKQETVRLKTQVDHLSQSLDQARTSLSEEREHAAEAAVTQADHDLLMSKINELTVYRESNATLRVESEAKGRRVVELDAKLKQVTDELAPAKQELLVLRAELDARGSQITRLTQDSRRWQERNQQLLTKYERIDPEELQTLKNENERLKAVETALKERPPVADNAEVDQLKKQVETSENRNKELTQRVRQQVTGLNKAITDLRSQVATLTAERDAAKTQAPSIVSQDSPDLKAFQDQIAALQREKTGLEDSLNEVRAKATELSNQTATLASVQRERDALLAEKGAWTKSVASTTTEGASGESWVEEKTQVLRERDEALANWKKAQEQENQLRNQLKQNYMQISNYRKQMQELEAEKKSLTTKQQAAIDTAVAAVKTENSPAVVPTNEEAEKKHAEELKALEERLRAEHKKELEAAATKLISGGTAENGAGADVETAVAAAKAEWEKAHEEEIEKAIERGRVEQQTKGRLKDAQLMRTQAKVKELEAKMMELQGSGAAPTSNTTATAPIQKPAPTQTTIHKPAPTQAPQKPAPTQISSQKPVPAANKLQQTAAQNKLPNRPTLATRGGGPGRALGGRGGAPTMAGQAAQNTGGVSIMGAAKRPREDAEGETPATDNSLAKRLKPAENKPTPAIKRPPPKQ